LDRKHVKNLTINESGCSKKNLKQKNWLVVRFLAKRPSQICKRPTSWGVSDVNSRSSKNVHFWCHGRKKCCLYYFLLLYPLDWKFSDIKWYSLGVSVSKPPVAWKFSPHGFSPLISRGRKGLDPSNSKNQIKFNIYNGRNSLQQDKNKFEHIGIA